MIKYPSIEQFRNIVRKIKEKTDYKGKDDNGDPIYKHDEDYPILEFKGTVKLHGTNAAVVKYSNSDIKYQSRERELSLQQDNAQFMLNMSNINLDEIFNYFKFENYVAIYGEWCGGNIQKGVALTELPKMFVIFGIKVDNSWINLESIDIDWKNFNKYNVYMIEQFPTYNIQIDFNNPEKIQNDLINLTTKVEEECPVGSYFGIKGIGEGIVFTSIEYPDFKFKSKGEKHSISKVKVINSINEEELNSIQEFIEYSVTENRLKQGLDHLKENNLEISQKNTGEYLRWVINDIIKEESDVLVKNQIDPKKVNSKISEKARKWFFNNI